MASKTWHIDLNAGASKYETSKYMMSKGNINPQMVPHKAQIEAYIPIFCWNVPKKGEKGQDQLLSWRTIPLLGSVII
jgi:hypothetical protein